MIRHPDPVIETIINVELTDAVGQRPPTPLAGADAEWLDDMILIGRMYVGGTSDEYTELCDHIQADREMRRLIQRLRGTACR